MTIYGKGCISNYRNCSLCYVCYSVLYRMLTDKISKKEYSTDKGKPPNTVLDNGSFWEFGLYGKIRYVNQSMNKTMFFLEKADSKILIDYLTV